MTQIPTQIASLSARERILVTAHELFYANGIRATGIDRIIEQAKVTKATFYRHFPSKNNLIIAFLEYRHQGWIAWFKASIHDNGNTLDALIPTLLEWFESEDYRGCAFINSVSELGETLLEVMHISQQHKHDMTTIIKDLLLDTGDKEGNAVALSIAIDGAIIRSQIVQSPKEAIEGLRIIIALFYSKY